MKKFYSMLETMIDLVGITHRFAALKGVLDERSRRLVVAAECVAIGRGGISAVSRATGMSRQVIRQGMAELSEAPLHPPGRVRRPGGGRKKTAAEDPSLLTDLKRLVEPVTRGDRESPLHWTCKSLRELAEELRRMGHKVSHQLVGRMLHDLGYTPRANSKSMDGMNPPDRNAQFAYVSRRIKRQLQQHQPVISVKAKKSGLVGDCERRGKELGQLRDPEPVLAGDLINSEPGPDGTSGTHDIDYNSGWVSLGMDDDAAAFAVECIRRWWISMGQAVYPQATRLLIAADSGGSSEALGRRLKLDLQKLADEAGIQIAVSHLPPGTCRWNMIEQSLLSFIIQKWRDKPLICREMTVNLIAGPAAATGLTVYPSSDTGMKNAGVKVSDRNGAEIDLRRDKFHGDWNYSLHPRRH